MIRGFKAVALIGGLLLFCAQSPLPGFPAGVFSGRGALDAGSAPSYSGPGDIVASATAWAGLRAYSAAYAASLGKIANICTPLDAVCADVSSDASGNFNLAGASSLLCNNSTSICTVKTLYDQSGADACTAATPCDLIQATIGSRPTLVTGCANGHPCMACNGISASNSISFSQPFTVSTVAKRTGAFTSDGGIEADQSGTHLTSFDNSANTIYIYAGSSLTATAADSAFHAIQSLFNGASSNLYIDGSSNTGNVGGGAPHNDLIICSDGFGDTMTGEITEFGLWLIAFSGGNLSAMNSNQHSYWGF